MVFVHTHRLYIWPLLMCVLVHQYRLRGHLMEQSRHDLVCHSGDKIRKFNNSSSDKCLKCATQRDSLIHAFWYREKIRKTWQSIEKWISRTRSCKVAFSPTIC